MKNRYFERFCFVKSNCVLNRFAVQIIFSTYSRKIVVFPFPKKFRLLRGFLGDPRDCEAPHPPTFLTVLLRKTPKTTTPIPYRGWGSYFGATPLRLPPIVKPTIGLSTNFTPIGRGCSYITIPFDYRVIYPKPPKNFRAHQPKKD